MGAMEIGFVCLFNNLPRLGEHPISLVVSFVSLNTQIGASVAPERPAYRYPE
jgi:hypothetical protein